MPIPVLRHHDAAQVGMAAKVNAEQVEDLALVKVRRGPDRGDAVECRIAAVETDDETKPLFQRHREYVVGNLKARLRGIPVHGSDVFEEVVAILQDSLSGA